MASDLKSSGRGGYNHPRPTPKPKAKPKPKITPTRKAANEARQAVSRKLRPAVPIVTEHTRGQANAIDSHAFLAPTQAHIGPVARPSEGITPRQFVKAADVITGGLITGTEKRLRHPLYDIAAPGPKGIQPFNPHNAAQGVVPWGPFGKFFKGAPRVAKEAAAAPKVAPKRGPEFAPPGFPGLKALTPEARAKRFPEKPATEAAHKHAERNGIDINAVKGTGQNGKILRGDVETHRVQQMSPEAQLRKGLAGAKSQYGKQKAARHEELSNRAQAVDKALREIADPDEAMQAAAEAMRGDLPKIDFHGLTILDGHSLKYLKSYVNQHPTLLPFQKINLNRALQRAFEDHRIPAPHEMRLIEHVFGKQTAIGFAQHAGNWGDKVINAMNIPRSLMATLDVSAIARQSLVAGASHPVIWGRNLPVTIRAMKSQAFYDRSLAEIKADPLYNLALAAKISFTDIGEHTPLVSHEEAFASDYATKIPGLGRAIKGSARSYTGFLNKMRMDLFKQQIRMRLRSGAPMGGDEFEKFLKQTGDVINAATGRGTIHGRAEHLMPAANTFLFSPRLMLSRINYLDPTWYVRLKGPARREALRGLFATAGAVTSMVYLFSKIPGVTVGSLDPRSADFGKLRSGNTRLDLAGGFQQYVRLAAELASQTSVSTTTGEKHSLRSGKFGEPTSLDVIQNFVFNKAAPATGIGINIARGHDAVGNPVTPQSIAENNFTPLVLQDAKQIYDEKHGGIDGIAWAMGGYGVGAVGTGLQTYPPKKVKAKVPTNKERADLWLTGAERLYRSQGAELPASVRRSKYLQKVIIPAQQKRLVKDLGLKNVSSLTPKQKLAIKLKVALAESPEARANRLALRQLYDGGPVGQKQLNTTLDALLGFGAVEAVSSAMNSTALAAKQAAFEAKHR